MLGINTSIAKALSQWTLATTISLAPLFLGTSARATERILIEYGPFSRSVSVASLEAFARDGTVDSTLRALLRRVSPERQENIRTALTASRSINPAVLSQLLFTPTGEAMLQLTGRQIQTAASQNGAVAIRGALVLAANQPEGISLLNFLKAFPTPTLRFDLRLAVAQFRQATRTIRDIDAFLAAVQQISEQEAAGSTIDFDSLPDIRSTGPFTVSSQTLMLEDTRRERSYPADIYFPQNLDQIEGDIPVVVLSHGLGSSRVNFREFADHLASHGFLVALPEHIGSNQEQQEAVKRWLDNELFKVDEFIDRPQDISFLLDELERLNESEFQGRLNTNQVGVMGHSFGGYTALALAGATIDFPRLQRLCQIDDDEVEIDVGLAWLLACSSLALESSPEANQLLTSGELQDQRVVLVGGFNPVSYLFGESGMGRIQVPVVILGGTDDIATPILREQAEPFSWLTTPNRYLVVAERISHNAQLTTLINRAFFSVDESDKNTEMTRLETRTTVAALLVAFSKVYVAGDQSYRPFLTSAFLINRNQDGFPLHMTQVVPPELVPATLD